MRRFEEDECPLRTPYQRDADRILHSKPFRRLKSKTQVFSCPDNDHITTRMEHSLYVASIARTVCDNIGYNGEVAYAAGLGHDLGHSAFGHAGEYQLDKLYRQVYPGFQYTHEWQSLRVVDDLYKLNLTYSVRDAIRCHCGESIEQTIVPRTDNRDPSTFVARKELPATVEGCVVRMADRVAYLSRDYDDARIFLGPSLPELPVTITARLGNTNSQIIRSFVHDMIDNWEETNTIGFTDSGYAALMEFRTFNYENIYHHKILDDYRRKTDRIIVTIFNHLCESGNMDIGFVNFVDSVGYDNTVRNTPIPVLDYIALMTDRFAFKMYKKITIPESLV